MNNQLGNIGEMLQAIGDLKANIASSLALPRLLVMPAQPGSTVHEATENLRVAEERNNGRRESLFDGIKVITSKFLPKQYECVGYTFRNPPPAKNRSLRLWKKLRYGTRKRHVQPIMEEVEYAFLFNQQAASEYMLGKLDELTFASMCGVITGIGA